MGDYQTHLESLGYRVEILEVKDEASVLWGAHPHRWNVRVSIQSDSTLITTAVVLPKEETKDRRGTLLELINQANGEAHAQLCLSNDGDLYDTDLRHDSEFPRSGRKSGRP